MTLLTFDAPPDSGSAYWRALRAAGKARTTDRLPDLAAVRRQVRVEQSAVAAFRQHFGLPPDGTVPPGFAHAMLGAPLQLQLLTHPSFPLRVLGTVHVRSRIVQHRALQVDERVTVHVRLEGLRPVAQGLEYDLLTEVAGADGAAIWFGWSTQLLRDPALPPRPRTAVPEPPSPAWERCWTLPLSSSAGRAYARLSGDWNPIHLSAWSARLFGFRRAILHGMATFGQVLACLDWQMPVDPVELTVRFRKPVFLPGRVQLQARRTSDQQGWLWQVQDLTGNIVHAEGQISRADGCSAARRS